MTAFTSTGPTPADFWLINGSPDFAIFPTNVFSRACAGSVESEIYARFPGGAPVRLHVGNAAFGQVHIERKHGAWLHRQGISSYELAYRKLQSKGNIYTTEASEKLKLSLRLSPEALMVLEWREHYFSIVTLYAHPRHLDGQHLGRYIPNR